MSITDGVVLLMFLLVLLLGALSYQLLRQNGRILLRLDELEARVAGSGPNSPTVDPASDGLPPGSVAPAFERPDLNGTRIALAGKRGKGQRGNKSVSDSHIIRTGLPAGSIAPDFRLPLLGQGELGLAQYRGKPLLLVFSDPDCGPCNRLAPQLESFHRAHSSLPIVMVSRGSTEANRQKASEFGLSFPVALQRQWEVSRLYGMFSTPIGFAIDAQGVIASGVATGADAIMALVSQMVAPTGEKEAALTQPG